MKRDFDNNKGFTLIELLVVLMILGILASIAVPSFTGYIDKQKEKEAIAECRQVVAAAQNMYNDQISKNNPDAIDKSLNYKEVAELAGVKGTITDIIPYHPPYDFSKETSESSDLTKYDLDRRVDGLTYIAENGVHVRYLYNDAEIYKVTDDSVYTPLQEYIMDYEMTIKEMIQNGDITKWYDQRSKYALDYLNYQKAHGGRDTFLKVEPNFLGDHNEGENLYWQPYYITNGENKNGVKGSTSTLLFATPNNGTEDPSTIHNRWYARLVYFKGHIYQSTNIESNVYQSNISSLNKCNSDEDVEAWLTNPNNKFEKIS